MSKGTLGLSVKFGVGDDEFPPEDDAPRLPCRILVVADLVASGPFDAGASPPAEPTRVSAARFDDLFARLRPRAAVEVESVLSGGKLVRVDFAPTGLRSFRPDGLCAELPLLRSLLDGRLLLERMREGSLDPEAAAPELERLWGGSPFAKELLGLLPSRPAPAPDLRAPAAAELRVESILDMVDVGGSPEAASSASPRRPAPSRFGDLVGAVARAGKAGPVSPAAAVAKLEKAIGLQVGAILQHPEIRRLERAYRGVRLVAERAAPHEGIHVDVISARPEASAEALGRALAAGGPAPTFAVVDLRVDGSAAAFTRLEELAALGEAHALPVIVSGEPALLGARDLAEVEELDHKLGLFLAPERAPWRAAAAKPALRWVAVAMNRVLARLPYDRATSRVREAAVVETPGGAAAKVFVEPAFAVAALAASSFREVSWSCRIQGERRGGALENLPVHEVQGQEGEAVAIPTEAFVSLETQAALAKAGVLLLASHPNGDAALVSTAPTAYVPPDRKTYGSATTEPEARLPRLSLADQLFVAELVRFSRALAGRLPPSAPPAELEVVFRAALAELFGKARSGGPLLEVSARTTGGGAAVSVTVRPERFLGVTLDEVSFELPIGG